MDENVVYIHNEVVFSRKMNEIMPFAGKWIRPIYHVK
jgi:hypothetical protein